MGAVGLLGEQAREGIEGVSIVSSYLDSGPSRRLAKKVTGITTAAMATTIMPIISGEIPFSAGFGVPILKEKGGAVCVVAG